MSILDLDLATDLPSIRSRLAAGEPLIACLCAEWCGACREYRDVFAQLAAAFPGLCFVWVDIENQAAVADAFDVENFPTLVIEDRLTTRFCGTLLPQRGILERLLGEFATLPGAGDPPRLRAALAA
ncbi:thioredoxin family protein [Robbsia sp. Bb-Pol-6]|uniref:Thioredoxin family protein n=1 Tax=Robbsia betulipollinis TaxID=2981849 RepID=A0ABT3ZKI9_9BURK|nr:thioredoxin family protein [Robbsia betulipollinis]MCY0386867.1 thioredoxin family protein [Robbsia betulipollinis]